MKEFKEAEQLRVIEQKVRGFSHLEIAAQFAASHGVPRYDPSDDAYFLAQYVMKNPQPREFSTNREVEYPTDFTTVA